MLKPLGTYLIQMPFAHGDLQEFYIKCVANGVRPLARASHVQIHAGSRRERASHVPRDESFRLRVYYALIQQFGLFVQVAAWFRRACGFVCGCVPVSQAMGGDARRWKGCDWYLLWSQ